MSDSPWKDNDEAFAPMFDESVVISGNRPDGAFSQTIEAAVFTDCTGDTTADGMMDTDREDIHICCKTKDLAFILKLRRGDLVQRSMVNDVKYAVQEVRRDIIMGWCIDARST